MSKVLIVDDEKTTALQGAMQGIISLLSSVVEARDPYTAGHQRRVGNLSAAIGEKMTLDAQSRVVSTILKHK